MIIGEDGSLSDARDIGNVLGLSTEEYNLELDKIKVNKLVPATVENEKAYLLRTDELENEFINTQSFQTALTNLDQKLIINYFDNFFLIQIRDIRSVPFIDLADTQFDSTTKLCIC
jgi:hypothetical protein